jgi:O-antigen/teichoic acid export membrane protein
VLIAPEFVYYLLGEKWLPMVFTFQLMVVYCLFDPLLVTASNLLTACGVPQKMTRVRVAQLVFFVPAVVVGAALWQINGIALAADGMLLVGLVGVFRMIRAFVDISLRKLFLAPTLGLLAGGAAFLLASYFFQAQGRLLWAVVKGLVFAIPFLTVLLLLEWRDYQAAFRSADNLLGLSRFARRSTG